MSLSMRVPITDELRSRWETLKSSIIVHFGAIRRQGNSVAKSSSSSAPAMNRMQMYTGIFDFVTANNNADQYFYIEFHDFIKSDLATVAASLSQYTAASLESITPSIDLNILVQFCREFDCFKLCRLLCSTVMGYIDSGFAKRGGLMPTGAFMNQQFLQLVWWEVKQPLVQTVVHCVNAYREGEVVDTQLLRATTRIFSESDAISSPEFVYFLNEYFAATKGYYIELATHMLPNEPGYVGWVESRMKLEEALVCEILQPELVGGIKAALLEVLVQPHAAVITQSSTCGVQKLVASGQLEDLQRLHALVSLVAGGSELVAAELRAIASRDAVSISADRCGGDALDGGLVWGLRAKWEQLLNIANTCLSNDGNVIDAIRDAFSEHLNKAEVVQTVAQEVIPLVNKHRNGETVDACMLRTSILFVSELSCKKREQMVVAGGTESRQVAEFFNEYFAATKQYYIDAATPMLPNEPGYVGWVESRMKLEEALVCEILQPELVGGIKAALLEVLVQPHAAVITQSSTCGVQKLVASGQLEDLRCLHALVSLVAGGSELIAAELRANASRDAADVVSWFATVIGAASTTVDCSDALDTGVINGIVAAQLRESAFCADNKMFHSINTFREHLDKAVIVVRPGEGNSSLGAVLLSVADKMCRGELKEAIDADSESQLVDAIVSTLSMLSDRSVFEAMYQELMAKRLLQTTQRSELERLFLSRLQGALGKSFTCKLEVMLQDCENAAAIQNMFVSQRGDTACNVFVTVLTGSQWPSYRNDDLLRAPAPLAAAMHSYKEFYLKRFSMRRLSWVHMLGMVQLTVAFPKGAKDVTLNVLQASVLLVVSSRRTGSVTTTQVASELNLGVGLVKQQVASMYLQEGCKLLSLCDASGAACPSGLTVGDGDSFTMNATFVHKLPKFKVGAPVQSKRASDPERSVVDLRRNSQVDAAVICVMKSHGALMLIELTEQVIAKLATLFLATPLLIKQRVEDLINREYLRWVTNDRNRLEYVA